MVQVIPQYDIGGVLGGALGGGLQAGMQTGLQQLLQRRQAEQQRGALAKSFESLGFTPEEATGISGLPPQVQTQIFKNRMRKQELEKLESVLGIGLGPTEEKTTFGPMGDIAEQSKEPGMHAAVQEEMKPIGEALPEPVPQKVINEALLYNPVLGKALQDREKLRSTETRERFKQTQKYRSKINEGYRDYRAMDMRLGRMSTLAEKGELIAPLLATTLDKFGVPLGVLNKPNSEEFEKLSVELTKNITSFYGARINIREFETFLKSIPRLNNSNEGRKRIIKNMQILFKPAELSYKAYQDVLKKHNGVPPYNIEDLVNNKIEPQLDKLADEFNAQSFERPGAIKGKTFEKLPSPTEYEGRTLTDKKTGKRYTSTGKSWRLQK